MNPDAKCDGSKNKTKRQLYINVFFFHGLSTEKHSSYTVFQLKSYGWLCRACELPCHSHVSHIAPLWIDPALLIEASGEKLTWLRSHLCCFQRVRDQIWSNPNNRDNYPVWRHAGCQSALLSQAEALPPASSPSPPPKTTSAAQTGSAGWDVIWFTEQRSQRWLHNWPSPAPFNSNCIALNWFIKVITTVISCAHYKQQQIIQNVFPSEQLYQIY